MTQRQIQCYVIYYCNVVQKHFPVADHDRALSAAREFARELDDRVWLSLGTFIEGNGPLIGMRLPNCRLDETVAIEP